MSLSPGARLGPYEIASAIGAGGMGEVYRARDTRLDRTVAIKILPSHLSANPQARERFDREAKAISSLSHPHICPLYDVGHQDGVDFLVMEYLEGETLSQRLKKGPLPPDQVLQYAIQITDALDTAHRHGVIHRDLKPGNIMLTKTGAKLLDFGLAKVQATEAAPGMTQLPTQTTPLTAEGTILGTMQYMAPEQLEGHEADARTDIFALGAVLYEMATGRKAFEGKSQASLISAIMSADPPPISTLQSMAPTALDHVVRTCLAKDPDARWQTAHDVLVELKWIAEPGSQSAQPKQARRRRQGRELVPWALLAVVSVALAVLAFTHFREKPAEMYQVRFQIPVPDKVTLDWFDWPVVSPDGRRIVFAGMSPEGKRMLWLHSLDSASTALLPGTDDAALPFWSPDSKTVAFVALGKLKKIDISGSPVQPICEIQPGPGGTWNQDGVIIFATPGRPLQRVSADGGEPRPILEFNKARRETDQLWPQFLPDGRHFLYLSQSAITANTGIFVGSLDSPQSQLVLRSASNASYAQPGFLVYVSQQILLAQSFDAKSLRVTGGTAALAQQVGAFGQAPGSQYAVSPAGVLTFRNASSAAFQLAWYNRYGKRIAPIGQPGSYTQIALSPDDKRLAVERIQSNTSNMWVLELANGIFSRLTFNPAGDVNPVWSPDGRELLYSSSRDDHSDLYRKAVGGSEEELVYHSDQNKGPFDWSTDGWILFTVEGSNFYRLPLAGERKPAVALTSQFTIDEAAVSRDGRWVAYESNESGRYEVYVASYPSFTGRRQVSNAGGCQPLWRGDGKELFYLTLDGKVAVIGVKPGSSLETGAPPILFQPPIQVNPNQTEYAVTRDGKRFIFREAIGETGARFTVVLNWAAGLKK